MTDGLFKEKIIQNGMKISLELKESFQKMFSESLGMKVPSILSSINMFYMIDICYSSSFLKNETKKVIENIDNNESKFLKEFYLLKRVILKN